VEYGACLIVKHPPTRPTEIAFKTTPIPSMTLNTSRTTLRAVNTTTPPNSPKSLEQANSLERRPRTSIKEEHREQPQNLIKERRDKV